MIIDTTFGFTTDSPHYWDRFRETDGGLGVGGSDPDSAGKTLKNTMDIFCGWSGREIF